LRVAHTNNALPIQVLGVYCWMAQMDGTVSAKPLWGK
jgi:hypothetical protein